MSSLIRMSDTKSDELRNKIINTKSKPALGKEPSYIGATFNTQNGEMNIILPRNAASDTIGRSMNVSKQIEAKQKQILRLQKKLAMREKN